MEADPFSLEQLIKSALALVAVCMLAVLVVGKLLPRWYGRGGRAKKEQGKKLQVVDGVVLGREARLVIVDTGDSERLLVSVGSGKVFVHGFIDKDGKVRLVSCF